MDGKFLDTPACCLSCAKISLSIGNKLFFKVLKFKIKSSRFCCFLVGDTQNNLFEIFYL